MKKRSIIIFLFLCGLSSVCLSESLTHPPAKSRGEWNELTKLGFSNWEIESYGGEDGLFDGGSKIYSFVTSTGIKFSVMAANPAYWTSDDKKHKRQVFYLLHKGRFYLLVQGDRYEKALLTKLVKVRKKLVEPDWHDPSDLDYLMRRLKSRQLMFKN